MRLHWQRAVADSVGMGSEHPWFLQDLPDYLAQPPEAFLHAEINDDALEAVATVRHATLVTAAPDLWKQMGFVAEEVRQAVLAKEHNQLTVSYYLSLETILRRAQREAGVFPSSM